MPLLLSQIRGVWSTNNCFDPWKLSFNDNVLEVKKSASLLKAQSGLVAMRVRSLTRGGNSLWHKLVTLL